MIQIRSDEINCAYLKFDRNYAKELIPRDAGGDTTIVHINISVLAFPFIDTVNLKFTADFFLNLRSSIQKPLLRSDMSDNKLQMVRSPH